MQVYHFPSRALLNPEKDASVLQDQEICIEPMRLHNKGIYLCISVGRFILAVTEEEEVGTSDKGPSEIVTTSLQGTESLAP